MRLTTPPASRIVAIITFCLVLAACGTGTPSPSPATSPAAVTATRSPAVTLPPPPTEPPTAPPTPSPTGSWPAGWDTQFCAAFEQVAVAQELAVDIGRAIDEDARDDAGALARELEGTSEFAAGLLAELPEWEPAQETVGQLVRLTDLGERLGRNYRRFINQNRRPALRRAQELAEEMRPVVESVEGELARLARTELVACPDLELVLEAP